MGTITNLYVIATGGEPAPAGSALRLAAALLDAEFVRPPVHVGPPSFRSPEWIIGPQSACRTIGDEPFHRAARQASDAAAARALLAETAPPALAAFPALNKDHPSVRKDFDWYAGYGCAVGAYSLAEPYRFILRDEPDLDGHDREGAVRVDRRITEWLHLQGKAAPWRDAYFGSDLERFIAQVWPASDVVEIADA